MSAQSGFVTSTASNAVATAGRSVGAVRARLAPAGRRVTVSAGTRTAVVSAIRHGIWWYALAGLVAGAGLVLASPFAAAIAALAVAGVGVGLSEGRVEGAARRVLFVALGLMLPAIAELIMRLVGLL